MVSGRTLALADRFIGFLLFVPFAAPPLTVKQQNLLNYGVVISRKCMAEKGETYKKLSFLDDASMLGTQIITVREAKIS
jgi:hypothetical protein